MDVGPPQGRRKNVLNLGGKARCKCTTRARVYPGDISVSGGGDCGVQLRGISYREYNDEYK